MTLTAGWPGRLRVLVSQVRGGKKLGKGMMETRLYSEIQDVSQSSLWQPKQRSQFSTAPSSQTTGDALGLTMSKNHS